MAISAQFRLQQTHSLALTPQLLQSIHLLQMTAVELDHFIDTELESNPLLERMEAEKTSDDFSTDHAAEDMQRNRSDTDDTAGGLSELSDISLENIYPDDPVRGNDFDSAAGPRPVSASPSYTETGDIALFVAEKPTIRAHLQEQIVFAFRNATECLIAMDLSEQIDESGYFTGNLDEVSKRFNVSYDFVERLFFRLQNFEPAGIFARDLAECLALQLKRRGRLSPAMEILLRNLPVLARRDFSALARICKVEENDVIAMLEEIRFLDPKPATVWSADVAEAIVPDAFVTEDQDGVFHVELNNAVLPRLMINRSYSASICSDMAERDFFSACTQRASWLLRALDQRATTLLKVIREIVRHQQAFLRRGAIALRPLNLAMIAEAVGMHESTVSRVTSHKYLATPRGIFELRSFFSAGVGEGEGSNCQSADAVRFQIRNMVEAETADNILSDDMIVERLAAEGIHIARRTVAKYRESMHIASSVIRKREKRHRK